VNKPKLMVIGLDAVSMSLLDNFKESCPAIRGLMRQGIAGRAMPCLPVYTPTNWAALSTGADASATGAAGWFNEHAGLRLSTFDRRAIKCDTIFNAAARAGLETLAIAYPSSHPTKSNANMILAPLDRGLVSNCLIPGKIVDVTFDGDGAFSFTLVEAPKALSGAALAKEVGATEDGADAAGKKRKAGLRQVQAYLFRENTGRWKLGFSADGMKSSLVLGAETWSSPIRIDVSAPDRPGRCVVRVMVFDEGRRLAVSEAYDIGALGKPPALAKGVYAELGPPTEHSVFYQEMRRLFSEGGEEAAITKLARRDLTIQADWIVKAAEMAQRTSPYDVFYLHYHHPDNVLHSYLAAAEGSEAFARKQHDLAKAAISTCLEICDRLVAGLLKLAGQDTTVLVVSDHGNVPERYLCNPAQRLCDVGLTVLRRDGGVDRRKSEAGISDAVATWIDVNAKPGTYRYSEIQARVIDALLDWKTDEGERVIATALRKKDSHLLGYYGPEAGDVTFHYNSGFSWGSGPGAALSPTASNAHHGPQMPVTFSHLSDNMPFFVLRGPGVKSGRRWDEQARGHIHITDLLPTVCHISGVPAPRQVTGAVRYELLKWGQRQ
jgi:hypothetical protein